MIHSKQLNYKTLKKKYSLNYISQQFFYSRKTHDNGEKEWLE